MTVLARDSAKFDGLTHEPHTQNFWVKVYTKDPYSINFLGPFASKVLANSGLNQYVAELEADGKTCVSSFQLLTVSCPHGSDECMTHLQWLQSLMEDYLHLNIPYS